MHSLGIAFAVLVTFGCFALTALSAPFPQRNGWGGGGPPPGYPFPQRPTPSFTPRPTPTPPQGTTTTEVTQPLPTITEVPQPGSITTAIPPPGSITTEVPTQGSITTAVPPPGSITTEVPTHGSITTAIPPQSTSGGSSGSPGQAQVINACSFPIYLVVCSQNPATCSGESTLAANSGTWSQAYVPGSEGGQSIKVSTTSGAGDILQFEYSNDDPVLWYDISEVNGNPFGQYGFTMTSTDSTCGQGHCAPPATSCPAIFTDPTNGIPYRCGISAGIGVTLCG